MRGWIFMIDAIKSLQNPKIKNAVKLAGRKTRNDTGLFLIEGYRELKRAVDSGVVIRTLFFAPNSSWEQMKMP